MPRVAALILHPGAGADAGPLAGAFATMRRTNAERRLAGFREAGAEARIVEDATGARSFGERTRAIAAEVTPGADGLVLLGSGSIPLARPADHRAFVAIAAGPAGHALANNRYSADVIALAGLDRLRELPDLASDNGLPRWLASTGVEVADLRGRWRLQVDLDSPLDGLLVSWRRAARALDTAGVELGRLTAAWSGVVAASRDPRRELLVAGRTSADGLAWLERSTASRTRALIEERGFRTRTGVQRPARSSLGLLLDRDGPEAFGDRLAELGDAVVVDTRVLLAHRLGTDESGWPPAEDRFASDLLLPERIADPWLRALTASAVAAPIPILLGGHSLVGPGLRLVLRGGSPGRGSWT